MLESKRHTNRVLFASPPLILSLKDILQAFHTISFLLALVCKAYFSTCKHDEGSLSPQSTWVA